MRANEHTMIVGADVVLVPYRAEHVAKYHEWMTSEELRELTASEPLTLEEEYEMQRKWQNDEDKLTFIILATRDAASAMSDSQSVLPMVGDVNLFLKGEPSEDDFEAEVEVMIAEPAFRRRGLALAALQLMLSYATSATSPHPLPVPRERLVARIGEKNEPSIRLFERLGFAVTKRVPVFAEVELRYMEARPITWEEGEQRVFAPGIKELRFSGF